MGGVLVIEVNDLLGVVVLVGGLGAGGLGGVDFLIILVILDGVGGLGVEDVLGFKNEGRNFY